MCHGRKLHIHYTLQMRVLLIHFLALVDREHIRGLMGPTLLKWAGQLASFSHSRDDWVSKELSQLWARSLTWILSLSILSHIFMLNIFRILEATFAPTLWILAKMSKKAYFLVRSPRPVNWFQNWNISRFFSFLLSVSLSLSTPFQVQVALSAKWVCAY